MDFPEFANFESSYSASISRVGGRDNNRRQRERQNAQRSLHYRAGNKKTVHCESHSRHEMSKVKEPLEGSDIWLVRAQIYYVFIN